MPATLTTPPVPSTLLSWYPPERRYTAEASELPNFRLGRVFDDACDEGFTLVSRAGYEVPMVLSHVETREGDVLWWDFTAVHPADARAFAGVRIWND